VRATSGRTPTSQSSAASHPHTKASVFESLSKAQKSF